MLLIRPERVFAGSAANESDSPEKAKTPAKRAPKSNVRIEIRCLGQFSISSANATSRHLQVNSRPLLLLQLLITGGPAGIERSDAEMKLWPHGQAELSDGALDTTLYRLRKLLGDPKAVTVENGIVRLSAQIVRVDAWQFSNEADRLEAQIASLSNTLSPGAIAFQCNNLLELYCGHFFAQDCKSPWVARMRDVLQSKYLRNVKLAGQFWQAARQWERAVALYETALEIDNLAEEIHRELMRCHLARREFADVVRVFRRCRELLSIVMGVKPSEATDAIYRLALAAQG